MQINYSAFLVETTSIHPPKLSSSNQQWSGSDTKGKRGWQSQEKLKLIASFNYNAAFVEISLVSLQYTEFHNN